MSVNSACRLMTSLLDEVQYVCSSYNAPPPQVNCLEPHPFAPVLAVSGLDHDPKIFSPISKDRTLKENVKDVRKLV